MNFYLSNNDQTIGPYSIEQIQTFLRQGLVTTTDQVWTDGWSDWMPIGNVPGIGFQPSIQCPDSSANEGPLADSPLEVQTDEGKNVPAKNTEVSSESAQLSPTVKGVLALTATCCLVLAICWIAGASYNVGVQSGAKSGVQAGFRQGVQAGAEAQSQQNIQTVNNVENTVNAARAQQENSTTYDSATSSSANTDTQNSNNSDSSPTILRRPDGTFAPAPQTAPQGFQ